MHPRVYQAFEAICRRHSIGGRVLEIGAVGSNESLLTLAALEGAALRLGVNLDRSIRHRDFPIVPADANRLPFANCVFDAVLCNSVLEHAPRFWLTLAEIRRVAKAGAVIAIGTPGFTDQTPARIHSAMRIFRLLGRPAWNWLDGALVLPIHDCPGDYYRFSTQAFREVFLADLDRVEIQTLLTPPRIIGVGFVPPVRPRNTQDASPHSHLSRFG
jgi:SAM-dependent methyltransferase